MTSFPPEHRPNRIGALDGARGAALAAMTIYHLVWDLDHFALVPAGITTSGWFRLAAHAIAVSFLFISGLSLAIASRRGLDAGKFLLRLAKITGAAVAVTIATWFAFPHAFVAFGILHCIAAASVISFPFARLPWWAALTTGALLIALPLLIQSPALDATNWWLGLGTREPVTFDWRPVLPWSGYMLLGLAAGKLLPTGTRPSTEPRQTAGPARAFCFIGRHSLAYYLLHQPILFGLLFVFVFLTGVGQIAGRVGQGDTGFLSACEKSCRQNGREARFCSASCICIAARTIDAGLWNNVMQNKLGDAQNERYTRIIRDCMTQSGKLQGPERGPRQRQGRGQENKPAQ